MRRTAWARIACLALLMGMVVGCAKRGESTGAEAGADPGIEKLMSGDRSSNPAAAPGSTAEPASPMVVPPPPVAATGAGSGPSTKDEEGSLPAPGAMVQVVDFAGFNKERESFKGRYLVVDGWATWCGICKEKFPQFLELEMKYRGQANLAFATIANDPAEKEEEVKEFLAASRANVRTFVLDEDPADFAATFNVNGVPAYLVYDPEGKIIFRAGKIEELVGKLAEMFP
jgi:thiol-disulfide isomerase/thioredoxin